MANSGTENLQTNPKKIQAKITTMPGIFYGGVEPQVQFRQEKKTPPVSLKPEILLSSSTLQKIEKPAQSVSTKKPIKNKKSIFLYVILFLIFILVLGGIAWYYLDQAGYFESPVPESTNQNIVPTTTEQIPLTPVETEPIQIPTSTPTTTVSEIEEPPSLGTLPLQFPISSDINTADLDQDSLTDLEESIFSTDVGIWDTDQDTYFDGQEILNLYNPTGFAPVRLIDSGLVDEYVSSKWQYRVYYPSLWEVGTVDSNGEQVLFSNINGEFIEIRVMPKDLNQSFGVWFAQNATGQNFNDLRRSVNRFQYEFYERTDALVSYFVEENAVFVLIYHPLEEEDIGFRNTMKMFVQSFRPSAVSVDTFVPIPGLENPQETEISTSTTEII